MAAASALSKKQSAPAPRGTQRGAPPGEASEGEQLADMADLLADMAEVLQTAPAALLEAEPSSRVAASRGDEPSTSAAADCAQLKSAADADGGAAPSDAGAAGAGACDGGVGRDAGAGAARAPADGAAAAADGAGSAPERSPALRDEAAVAVGEHRQEIT